jgi:hypothetical protein
LVRVIDEPAKLAPAADGPNDDVVRGARASGATSVARGQPIAASQQPRADSS